MLEDNECSLDKAAFVDWEPLYNLKASERPEATCMSSSDSRGASSGPSPGAINDYEKEMKDYVKDFKRRFGSYEDTASGDKLKIEEMSISVQASLSEPGKDLVCSPPRKSETVKCEPANSTKHSALTGGWLKSEHEGLLTLHDGTKRWYHSEFCDYRNDRLYHSKIHFQRIHVKNGKSMPRKRKYVDEKPGAAGTMVLLTAPTL